MKTIKIQDDDLYRRIKTLAAYLDRTVIDFVHDKLQEAVESYEDQPEYKAEGND